MENQLDDKFVAELLKRLPVQIFWKDTDGIYLGCNDAFVRSLGLKNQDQIIGKTDFTLPVAITEATHYRKDDLEVIEKNQPRLNIEEEQTFPDGKKVHLLTSKVPLSIKNNGINGLLGIYSDITELKLTQEQLKLEKEKAEFASQSKSEFIANMSHDLRTPITGILGLAQDMINTADYAESRFHNENQLNNDTLKNLIKTVQQDSQLLMGATEELLRMFNDILEVTCLESGKINDNIESFSLHEMISHHIELLQPVAHHKKLRLTCDVEQQLPSYFKGSRIYFERVILNLLSNALKFTKKGSVSISANITKEDNIEKQIDDQITIEISVKDTGIGIPKNKIDIIFEHFSRLTPSYDGLYQGAGLGLYMVKRYVETMQGTIAVFSEVNKGTCFTVTLPLTISKSTDATSRSFVNTASIKLDNEQARLGDQNPSSATSQDLLTSILVVEDNTLAAKAVSISLKTLKCSVDIAKNGACAVQLAQEKQYDLILMDVGLPDLNGIEVTKQIRSLSDPKKSQVPIIAVTGHANAPQTRQECISSGMQEVMCKPAQPKMLFSILQKYVFDYQKHKQHSNEVLISANNHLETLEIIDWDACVRLCDGQPDLTYEMLSALVDDLESTKYILDVAYAKGDTQALRAELHRCRGGVCYLKLPQLDEALRLFHEAVKRKPQDMSELDLLLIDLYKAFDNYSLAFNKQKNIFNSIP